MPSVDLFTGALCVGVLGAVASSMVESFIHVVRIAGCAHALVWVARSPCVGAQDRGARLMQLGVLPFSASAQVQA
ncbi:hypothetical protein [Xanthomonas arboricola]|uniref:hypothetical protein n=1 Tax=Xanthomonas arboricola TaxID=56448 RepID=UPI0012906C8B|nr:hypothetical protein [Xanthomonas arboricola]